MTMSKSERPAGNIALFLGGDSAPRAAASSGDMRDNQKPIADASCCSPIDQATCCAPAAKASCCGDAHTGGCGCR